MGMIRVNARRKILCPICNHGDWCGLSGDRSIAICMRIESDKPTQNGGWLHRLSDPIAFQPKPVPRPAIQERAPDLMSLWNRWQRETDPYYLDGFAMTLNVDTEALRSIGCAWTGRAWAFPMKDASGKMIGIRLRAESGSKWAVTGSHQGLFFSDIEDAKTVFLVEGPTDLAAALTLGLKAFARPACLGQEQMLLDYVRRVRANRLVIVSDNDLPGLRGAEKLQGMLPIMNCVYVPPAKDLREFVSLGGTKDLIESSIRDLVWTRPRAIAA